ncbi:hypothetical protein ACFLZN_00580 [Nanoarchaeota archaeon]
MNQEKQSFKDRAVHRLLSRLNLKESDLEVIGKIVSLEDRDDVEKVGFGYWPPTNYVEDGSIDFFLKMTPTVLGLGTERLAHILESTGLKFDCHPGFFDVTHESRRYSVSIAANQLYRER